MMRPSLLMLCLLSSAGAEVVTAVDPFVKMPEGKTVVWSPLFQATWDAMNTKMGGKPQGIEPPNELMSRLDSFKWDAGTVLPHGSWKTWAGQASPEFLDLVNREAAKMTGEKKGPFRLDNPQPGTLACFGLLDREVEFAKPFYRSAKVPLKFGDGKDPVHFFGTTGDLAGFQGDSVKVLAYRPVDGSHALEVSCKRGDDTVVFYMPPAGQDFATACKWLREWRKTYDRNAELPDGWNDRSLHEGDEVRVPYVTLDVTEDLAGQLQGGRFYGKAGDPWAIRRAEQRTKFELHEKGARVRVVDSIQADPFGGAPPPAFPREFFYDRPYFVFLWREKAEWPYLGVWVGDTSALRKF
jgi:hypothetical protein